MTPLEPGIMVDEWQDHGMTGADEAAAINFEQEHGESHLPRVQLTNAGISNKKFSCCLFWSGSSY